MEHALLEAPTLMLRNAPESPSRGILLVATLLVVLGAYGAFTTLVAPIGPEPLPPPLWLAGGIAALGTALAGVRILQGRQAGSVLGIVTISAWLIATAIQVAILGLPTFANPFTVGQAAILLVALAFLVVRG